VKTVPLRAAVRLVNGGTPTSEPEHWDGDVHWATPIDLAPVDGGTLHGTARRLTQAGLRNGSAAVPEDSLLVSIRAPIGYVSRTTASTAFNQGCRGLVPRAGWDCRFLQFVLMDQRANLLAAGTGSTFQELSSEALAATRVPLVGREEQRRIADFLDDQVTRLDAAATCARAVAAGAQKRFRGILSDTMDSTPACAPVKALVERITSGPRGWGDLSAEDGSVFLRIANLPHHGTTIVERDVQRVAAPLGAERERTRTRPGDVLVSITASLGDIGLVRDDWTSDANVSQHIALLRPRSDCSAEWLDWALQTPRSRDALTLSGYGGTKVGLVASRVRCK
jgi:type I restriction enzyme S subunit